MGIRPADEAVQRDGEELPRYEYFVVHMHDIYKATKKGPLITEVLNSHSKEGWEHYHSVAISSGQLDLYFRRWKEATKTTT